MEKTITNVIQELNQFNMPQAYEAVKEAGIEAKKPSIRARVYEAVDKGILRKIAKGIYQNNNCLLIQGDGKDLSFLGDGSIDAIITDHPYDIKAANNGGDRHFATYDCFQYTQEDFNEKARVLKEGCFLVEFLPEESALNYEYLYKIKKMAEAAGFKYYAKVPWKKGDFISNCGRKSKNTEDVMIFSKGEPRSLRVDAKKDKADPSVKHFMKGCNGMLPTVFDFAKPAKKEMLHQAEKPVELLEAILEYVTKEDEVVLDQFAGSGVLGEACIKKHRHAILIELAEEFVAKIANRLKLVKA